MDSQPPPRKPRGFAAMSPELQRQIASQGGKAAPPQSRSFAKDHALAVAAGRKGGAAGAPGKRSFSVDPALAREAGRAGGRARRPKSERGEG